MPPRLGRDFRWLLGSSWVSQVGDGIALAAGPLLIASQTHDPFLVAMGALLQRLPWLLFGLYAGVVADRLDRLVVVVAVDVMRAVVLGILVLALATGVVNIGLVLVVLFLFGTAEVFADTTSSTLLPMVVAKRDLGIANARLTAGFVTVNQMLGPPVGAALFAAGMAWPFVAQAVCVLLGAALIAKMRLPAVPAPEEPKRVRHDILEGLRWTWRHPAVRTLTLTIVAFNITFGAAWSVLVLYSLKTLDMGEVGFGLLTTAGAIGGMVAIGSYDWLERHFSLGNIMRVGLIIETFTHLALALNRSGLGAIVIMFVFGAHAFVWGTTSRTVRMRAVPTEFQGRVGSVYLVGVFGSMVIGTALGGVIAGTWGIVAPFWFAFVGSALLVVLIWRQMPHIAHADEALVAAED
ncbi:MFS transporter [Nocardioides sp. Root140]|uniref:MFS transporter n=1 Tax=Nocardioides sp. Root140 TaxID=1736460 RepID=UPI0006FDBC49|nr:MFS transporter [Nocardioides sp. Root140]KQY63805.1 antibiotic transporter [Nocardioides sp. Root140]